MFAIFSGDLDEKERRLTAMRGVLVASVILFLFALLGEWILSILGISLAALRAAGGVLLLLIGIDMVAANGSSATTTTREERKEAEAKADIAVFPPGNTINCRTGSDWRGDSANGPCRGRLSPAGGGGARAITGDAGGAIAGEPFANTAWRHRYAHGEPCVWGSVVCLGNAVSS